MIFHMQKHMNNDVQNIFNMVWELRFKLLSFNLAQQFFMQIGIVLGLY
jgi:hypothetical protein